MTISGVTVRKNAGLIVPDAYLVKAIAANKTCIGMAAVIDAGDGISVSHFGETASLEEVQESMTDLKDSAVTYFLGNSDPEKLGIPPFVLLSNKVGAETVPTLVAFCEGDFGDKPMDLIDQDLKPLIEELFEENGKDFDKMWAKLGSPLRARQIVRMCNAKGSICLLGINNKFISWTSSDAPKAEYPWGFVTNTYGYSEAPPDTATETVKPTSKLALLKAKKLATAVPLVPPVEEPDTDTAAHTVVEDSVLMSAPKHLTKAETRAWYHKYVGYCPKGYKNHPEVNVKKSVLAAISKQTGSPQTYRTFQELPKNAADPAPVGPAAKDTAPKHIDPLPIIPPNVLKEIQKLIPQVNNKGINPSDLGKMETEISTFTEQNGWNLEDTFGFDLKKLIALGKIDIRSLAYLAIEWKNAYLNTLAEEEKAQRQAM